MKKIITIYAAILMTTSLFAQAPNKMSYQAVIRNTSGALVTSTSVGMRISILQGSSSGTAVYVETQTPTTNANGLASIEIGGGSVVSGIFSTIDWANGPYFIKTETDPSGGTSYSITGTSQLLSVPYALHAKNTDAWTVNADTVYTSNWVGIGTNSPDAPLHVFDGQNGNASVILRNGYGTSKVLHIIEEQASSGHYGLFIGAEDYSAGVLVTKGGNVGIGTTTPLGKFHLNNDVIGSDSSFVVMNNGNVGIGTNNPSLKLFVEGDIVANGGMYYVSGPMQSSFPTTVNGSLIYGSRVSGTQYPFLSSGNLILQSVPLLNRDIVFVTGSTPSIKMNITSNGNVGIGTGNTITPARTLHVNSVMRLEPIATAPSNPGKGDMYFDNTLNKLRVYDGTTWQNCW